MKVGIVVFLLCLDSITLGCASILIGSPRILAADGPSRLGISKVNSLSTFAFGIRTQPLFDGDTLTRLAETIFSRSERQLAIYGLNRDAQAKNQGWPGLEELGWSIFDKFSGHLKKLETTVNLSLRNGCSVKFNSGVLRALNGMEGHFVSKFHDHTQQHPAGNIIIFTEPILGPGPVFTTFEQNPGTAVFFGLKRLHRSPRTEELRLLLLADFSFYCAQDDPW